MNRLILLQRLKLWSPKTVVLLFLILILGLIKAPLVNGQNPTPDKPASNDRIDGVYEGVAKGSSADAARLKLEIANDKGKLTGRLVAAEGAIPIAEGTFVEGKLTLKLGDGATKSTLNAQIQGDNLNGDWTSSGQKRSIELKRVPTSLSGPPVETAGPAAEPASLTGDWDGIADAQGQGFPFLLTLKIDGEKVTGESNSSLGQATISNGSFKDGKLVFQLDSQNGPISMSAVIKDGGLVGEFDYAGQMQGRWVAKKRTP